LNIVSASGSLYTAPPLPETEFSWLWTLLRNIKPYSALAKKNAARTEPELRRTSDELLRTERDLRQMLT
jgi:hypothetical protein